MTPKEKAQELLDKFNLPTGLMSIEKKQCALIAVDEIIEFMELDDTETETCFWLNSEKYQYYQEVKKELEAMK